MTKPTSTTNRVQSSDPHWKVNQYGRGCRCVWCKEYKRNWMRKAIAKRFAARVEVCGRMVYLDPSTPHGTVSTYNNYGCRCEECTEAKKRYYRRN